MDLPRLFGHFGPGNLTSSSWRNFAVTDPDRDPGVGGLTQVADLKGQRISDFAFSPDRKRVAIVSSVATSDVIMVEREGR